jgi:hypothetical protein
MIQRIQSIWLLLASACAFASLKVAFYTGNLFPEPDQQDLTNLYHEINGMDFSVITIGVAVMCLFTIFLYSNRKLQLRFCLATFFAAASSIILYYYETKTFKEGSYALGAILQPMILLFILLAIVGIRKDRKIVAESDRLR